MVGKSFVAWVVALHLFAVLPAWGFSWPWESQPPIKIGLAANLSGQGGTAGDYIRDGALLAVEEANDAGGVRGRKVELLIRDDRNTPDGVLQADRELIEQGAMVIVGHLSSSLTLTAYPYVTGQNVLLFTPYTGTDKLSGRDDLFFRTSVDTRLYGNVLGRLLQEKGYERVSFLIDLSNPSFGEGFVEHTQPGFKGKIVPVSFKPKEVDWARTIGQLLEAQPQAIVVLSEVTGTGIVAQKLRAQGYKGDLIATLWAQTPDLMRYGGQAVEGMSILTFIDADNSTPKYLEFSRKMQERFKTPANARSVRAYEAMQILLEAMRRAAKVDVPELKAALLANTFETVMGMVRFDRFGDVDRPVFELKVQQGRFVRARTLH